MNLGKMLSFISPAYGLASGHGLGKIMPYLSPGLGMMMGKGLFDHHGGGGEDDQQQAQMPVPGAMGGMPMQQQPGQMPTGMFGSPGQGNPTLSQWLMMNRGGY